MQVTTSNFFCKSKYEPILTACQAVEMHENYPDSPLAKSKITVIKSLFQWEGQELVDLDFLIETLSVSFNEVLEKSKKRNFLEYKAEKIELFFMSQLENPIRKFKEWCRGEIRQLCSAHRVIIISKEFCLNPLIEKVKKIMEQYPEKLSQVFIKILEEEEREENRKIQELFSPLEKEIEALTNRLEKLEEKQSAELSIEKSSENRTKQAVKISKRKRKIAAYRINLIEVQTRIIQKYQGFMRLRENLTDFQFLGEQGYFKDHTYTIVEHRWLRTLLSSVQPIEWKKIADCSEKNFDYYQSLVDKRKSNNRLIKKVAQDILPYLRALSNEQIDQADASGAKTEDQTDASSTKIQVNKLSLPVGTIGGNRSLVSNFVNDGLVAIERAKQLEWKTFDDKEKVEGLYYSYRFLAHLQTAHSSKEQILEQGGESASNKNYFSPRTANSDGSLTARNRLIDQQPIEELNKKLQIDPNIGTQILSLIFNYLNSIQEAKFYFEKMIDHPTCSALITQQNLDPITVLTTFEKQIQIINEKLKEQNLI